MLSKARTLKKTEAAVTWSLMSERVEQTETKMAAPLLSQVIFKIRVPSKKPKTLNPMNITVCIHIKIGGKV